MSQNRLQDLLNLSNTKRWTIRPTLRDQSVAEHSFRVAVIAMEICRALNQDGLPSSNVIEYHVLVWALVHDGPEAETGDIPYTAKRNIPDEMVERIEHKLCPWYEQFERRIHPPELAIIKIADKVEEVLYLREWGTSGSDAAQEMAFHLACERVWEAASRFGWSDLPYIVGQIIGWGSTLPEPGRLRPGAAAVAEPVVEPVNPEQSKPPESR